MDKDQYISMKEAAEIAGLTVAAVSFAAKRGYIGQQVAGHWIFTHAEMERYRDRPKNKGGRPKSYARIPSPVVLG